jgi:hypothetical protein
MCIVKHNMSQYFAYNCSPSQVKKWDLAHELTTQPSTSYGPSYGPSSGPSHGSPYGSSYGSSYSPSYSPSYGQGGIGSVRQPPMNLSIIFGNGQSQINI